MKSTTSRSRLVRLLEGREEEVKVQGKNFLMLNLVVEKNSS